MVVDKNNPEMIGWYLIERGGVQIEFPKKGVWPSTYLSYAQTDYEEYEVCRSPRALINAVSNAKRALHYQVDALSSALGWEKRGGKRKNDFPSKLEFLGACGVISPIIIKRVNKLRNTIEHEYYFPSDEEALEYLEIVELYLAATHMSVTYFPENISADVICDDEEYDAGWGLPDSIRICMPEGVGRLHIDSGKGLIVDVSINDGDYYSWVSAVMRQMSCR